ncbi:MAG: hypothetical protein IPL22_06285 [Bacteroidetes bacterium]|nr:hypothetical protein [Bacteroidota bacterium]
MIEIELRKNNYPQLVNHFWLTITQVTSSDDSDMALFLFNERVLKSVFEILKNNQNIIYSPFELAAAFIVEKVPDEGMAYFREEKYDVVLEFSKCINQIQIIINIGLLKNHFWRKVIWIQVYLS